MKEKNPNWPQIPDYPYRILIIGVPESGKTNALLNLINHQPGIDKSHLYPKYSYKVKHQLLINKHESVGFKQYNDSKGILNTRMIWMIFVKTLMNTIQI